MFYIRFERTRGATRKELPSGAVRYVGIPQQYVGLPCYYQIYENGRPLANMHFATRKEARMRLKTLSDVLHQASNGWYDVECKTSPYRPIGSIVGFRKIYSDGSSVNLTYVVKKNKTYTVICKNNPHRLMTTPINMKMPTYLSPNSRILEREANFSCLRLSANFLELSSFGSLI